MTYLAFYDKNKLYEKNTIKITPNFHCNKIIDVFRFSDMILLKYARFFDIIKTGAICYANSQSAN